MLSNTTPVLDSPTDPPAEVWTGPSWMQGVQEVAVRIFLGCCALITVLTTVGIVVVLGYQTLRFFSITQVNPIAFVTGTELDPDGEPPQFGIFGLIWGTIVIAAGSSIIAIPIGLLSAIYLSEYAPRKLRSILKPALELLAGIPSIVYGYLALMLVTPALQWAMGFFGVKVEPFNILSACIVVGIMIIPMVSSLSEDVLSAVPRSLREAAYGLGATKFEVSTRIVLPAGLSGVMAAFILAASRAIGETMAVVLAAGVNRQLTFNPLRSLETMTAYIVGVIGGDPGNDGEYLSLFAVGMVLFLITLVLNILSNFVLRRFREVYQ